MIQSIQKALDKGARKFPTLQFAMELPQEGISYGYSSTHPSQTFHSASTGKLFTTVLLYQAIEEGLCALDTPVKAVLGEERIQGLFSKEGATIGELLNHTSGINDYFESDTFTGTIFLQEVLRNPDRFFTPMELVDFTRKEQKPIGEPGERFLYSDTGFILLGLILETLWGKPYQEILKERIFDPCELKDTALCFYSDNFHQEDLAPLLLGKTDVRTYRSLSCDWAGGGLQTTASDLLRFLKELREGRLLGAESLGSMARFDHPYRKGIVYGSGMMQLRFEEFFFLLKHLPRLQGHLGVTGVHLWYDPQRGDSFVLNVGSTQGMVASFRLLIQILNLVIQGRRKGKNKNHKENP